MKFFCSLIFLLAVTSTTFAQLLVNQIDLNQLDIEYCQLICEYPGIGGKTRIFIDYGQSSFRERANNELRPVDSEGKPAGRFDTVMQAVNFVEKAGWEVVSFQVTHAGSGSSDQFIYLMRKKRKR